MPGKTGHGFQRKAAASGHGATAIFRSPPIAVKNVSATANGRYPAVARAAYTGIADSEESEAFWQNLLSMGYSLRGYPVRDCGACNRE